MPWFKVDDSFHAHPKVLATEPDALGLWVVAGAWSSSHLTDGFVPDHALPRLLPDSATLARKLVAAGLWRKVRGGYQFHDWSDFQPSADEVRSMREKRAAAGRLGGKARAAARKTTGGRDVPVTLKSGLSTGEQNRSHSDSPADDLQRNGSNPSSKRQALAKGLIQPPTRPLPSTKEGRGGGAQSTNCRQHRGQPADNCALCRSEALGAEP